MLVRNTDQLQQEILGNLRQEYLEVIAPCEDNLHDLSERLLLDANKILFDSVDPSNQIDLFKLQTAESFIGNPVLPMVNTARIHLTPYEGTAKETGTDLTSYLSIQLFAENLFRGFIPEDPVNIPGQAIHIMYFKDPSNDTNIIMQMNICIEQLGYMNPGEAVILNEALPFLERVQIEYEHYMKIFKYFQSTLFEELSSLNAMYKVCPSITRYINESTSTRLFQKIKEVEPNKEFKPTNDVVVALGRSKLRGN